MNEEGRGIFNSENKHFYGGRSGTIDVDFSSIVKDYLSFLTDIELGKLTSLQSVLLSTLETSKDNIKSIDYSGWNDEVSNKLIAYTKKLDIDVENVEKDISSGNFIMLVNELKKLRSECEKWIEEDNRVISLHFNNEEDKKEYNASGSIKYLSQIGKNNYYNYQNLLAAKNKNLSIYESNIRTIASNLKNISFDDKAEESIILTDIILNKPFNTWRGNYLITDFFEHEGQNTRMVFDPETGNRAIESDGEIILIKTSEDGSVHEWYLNNDSPLDSDQVYSLLKEPFQDVSEGGWTIKPTSSYGPNGELIPGRYSGLFNKNLPSFNLNIGDKSYVFSCFPGDATMSFLSQNGVDVSGDHFY